MFFTAAYLRQQSKILLVLFSLAKILRVKIAVAISELYSTFWRLTLLRRCSHARILFEVRWLLLLVGLLVT